MSSTKKTVLIVGGGVTGAKLAHTLSQKLDPSKYNLTLVSSSSTFVHLTAAIRTAVTAKGNFEERMFLPYTHLFEHGNGKVEKGTVVSISAERGSKNGGTVKLDDGRSLSFDVLALAPGSIMESYLTYPGDKLERRAHIREWREKFKNAEGIAIAGGGTVGLELAGELRDTYPNKSITIVHSGDQVLNPTYPSKFRAKVLKQFKARNIKFILGDCIDTFPATTTRKGVELNADLVIPARGSRPNTKFIAESLGSDVVSKAGFVKANPTLQLASYPSIFVLGDVVDIPEQKQAAKASAHVAVAHANIISVLNDKNPTKKYKGTFEAILITNGRKAGIGFFDVFWGLIVGKGLSATMKSKNLFINLSRKDLGLV